MEFEYAGDREFFDDLLREIGGVDRNAELFDFRDPDIKRKEFGKIRNALIASMIQEKGNICELQWSENCKGVAEHIDHTIPLKTNKLNKLRGLLPEKRKKVKSQSFGSNSPRNLILACANCNNAKKHQFMSKEQIGAALKQETK